MSSERNYGIAGFLAGAAVGATLGILFAPRAGKDTRELIAKRARAAKVDLDELIERGQEQWVKAKGKAADAATMTKDEVMDFVRSLFDDANRAKNSLMDEAEETAHEVHTRARREHSRHSN